MRDLSMCLPYHLLVPVHTQPFFLFGTYGVGRIPINDDEFNIPTQSVVELRFPASIPTPTEAKLKTLYKVCSFRDVDLFW